MIEAAGSQPARPEARRMHMAPAAVNQAPAEAAGVRRQPHTVSASTVAATSTAVAGKISTGRQTTHPASKSSAAPAAPGRSPDNQALDRLVACGSRSAVTEACFGEQLAVALSPDHLSPLFSPGVYCGRRMTAICLAFRGLCSSPRRRLREVAEGSSPGEPIGHALAAVRHKRRRRAVT